MKPFLLRVKRIARDEMGWLLAALGAGPFIVWGTTPRASAALTFEAVFFYTVGSVTALSLLAGVATADEWRRPSALFRLQASGGRLKTIASRLLIAFGAVLWIGLIEGASIRLGLRSIAVERVVLLSVSEALAALVYYTLGYLIGVIAGRPLGILAASAIWAASALSLWRRLLRPLGRLGDVGLDLIPDLHRFAPQDIALGFPIRTGYLVSLTLYGLCFSVACLAAAAGHVATRDLPLPGGEPMRGMAETPRSDRPSRESRHSAPVSLTIVLSRTAVLCAIVLGVSVQSGIGITTVGRGKHPLSIVRGSAFARSVVDALSSRTPIEVPCVILIRHGAGPERDAQTWSTLVEAYNRPDRFQGPPLHLVQIDERALRLPRNLEMVPNRRSPAGGISVILVGREGGICDFEDREPNFQIRNRRAFAAQALADLRLNHCESLFHGVTEWYR